MLLFRKILRTYKIKDPLLITSIFFEKHDILVKSSNKNREWKRESNEQKETMGTQKTTSIF